MRKWKYREVKEFFWVLELGDGRIGILVRVVCFRGLVFDYSCIFNFKYGVLLLLSKLDLVENLFF